MRGGGIYVGDRSHVEPVLVTSISHRQRVYMSNEQPLYRESGLRMHLASGGAIGNSACDQWLPLRLMDRVTAAIRGGYVSKEERRTKPARIRADDGGWTLSRSFAC